MAFSTTKLTLDTDDGRINSSPSTVILPSGQQFCFYSKFLTTGKESFSRITFVDPSFTVSVQAGSGTINGIPVTWGAGTLTAPANSYNIVYVTAAGVLGIGSNLTMNFLNDVILLAYVSSGNSSITRIDELEHTGNYIYVRKQILLGSEWVWDDYEILLNTGSEPICFYNSITGEIYLSYTKDSSSYVRTFKPEVDLTWEYLTSIAIAANVNITLKKDPENTAAPIGLGSGYSTSFQLNDGLFPLGASGFSFVDGNIHVFLPYLSSSYLAYTRGEVTYEFFIKSGDEYILEATYTIDNYRTLDLEKRHRLWSGTLGVKYVGIRMKTTLYQQDYVTPPTNYGSFEIYNFPNLTTLSESNYSVDTRDNRFEISLGSGYAGMFSKTAEYEENRDFESDTYSQIALGSGYAGVFSKTAEYEETRDFESDTYSQIALGSGYATDFSVTNIQ